MPTVTREIDLPVEPDEAWADVSDAQRLAEWLDEEVELDAWEGGEVRIGERAGTVREVDAGRLLRFTWGQSEVTFTVIPLEHGSRVRVTETAPVATVAPRLSALALCPA
ncbi:MAG: SRPBCC domain-containing protein [Acidimicrobiia bacterium]